VLPSFGRPGRGAFLEAGGLLLASVPGLWSAARLVHAPGLASVAALGIVALAALAGGAITASSRWRGEWLLLLGLVSAAGPLLEAALRDLGAGDWPLGALSPYVWIARLLG